MEYLIRVYCPPKGFVLDPFCGTGTTGVAALPTERSFLGIECNEHYAAIAEQRCADAELPTEVFPGVLDGV